MENLPSLPSLQHQRTLAFQRELNLYNQTFSQYFVLSYNEYKELTKEKTFRKTRRKKVRAKASDLLVTLQQLATQLLRRGMVYEAFRGEVKRRFLKGEVHPEEVNAVWLGLAEVEQLKAIYDKDYYERLAEQTNLPACHQHQIDVDINRGLCSVTTEKDQGAKREVLRELLHCYATRNNVIGYCQSFSMMAFFLLERGLGKVDTFFLLTHLLERLFPWDYYIQMHSLHVDLHLFRNLLLNHLPSLYSHLAELSSQVDIFTLITNSWFLTVFTYTSLPWPMLTHIWTALLLYGRVALICAALAIFTLQSDLLMAAKSFEEVIPLLKEGLARLTDVHVLHQQMLQFPLSRTKYRLICEKWLKTQQTIASMQQRQSQNSQSSSLSSRQCNPSYFHCLAQPKEINECLVLSSSLSLRPDMDYIQTKGPKGGVQGQQHSTNQSVAEEREVVVVRSEHICLQSVQEHLLNTSIEEQYPQQFICCSLSMPDLE